MTDLSQQTEKLRSSINSANKILITSHISPDPDSICSMLLLGTTLRTNYPDKIIVTSSEELLDELSYLNGYERIQKDPLLEVVTGADLIILTDSMNFERASRKDGQEVSRMVQEKEIPLVIIDHHEQKGVEASQIYINEDYPSCVQQVFKLLFTDLKLKKPVGFAETTMVGLYSDTGGFTYINKKPDETLQLIAELIKEGIDVQQIKNRLNRYSFDQMTVLKELLSNISAEQDYTYSYLPDGFVDQWLKDKKLISDLNKGASLFRSQYIRNIDGREWGFTVYKEPLLGDGMYSVSLRSLSNGVDVAAIAERMGGGGHKPAAGGKVEAVNIEEAVNKVKRAIQEVRNS